MKFPAPKIIVALDFSDSKQALALVDKLSPELCRLKVGKELFVAAGPQLVETLAAKGFSVFLDLKFHDIPNTVAKACAAAANLGVWMMNVHAIGGSEMMSAARSAVPKRDNQPLLIAVTILTSQKQADLVELGIQRGLEEQVLYLATLAQKAEFDGVVCSAQEATGIKQQLGKDFCLVTPGIRPANVSADDQKRIMTPEQALIAGSDYLVIGRAITQAKEPRTMLHQIIESFNPLAS